MNKTFKKISQVFKYQTENKSGRHLRNIEKGEKIKIDGKEFVKVELKFVDTMDFNLAKHVDNLESENILLKRELHELKEQSDKCNLKIEQLQICTKNVIQENTRLKEQNKKEQNQKDVIIEELTNQLNDQNKTIETHKKIINVQEKKNNEPKVENKSYQKTEKILKDKIILLEKKIKKLTIDIEKDQDTLNSLNKITKRLEKSHKTTENELKNNQILNKTLTEKLFNQKNEIDYLKEKLKTT